MSKGKYFAVLTAAPRGGASKQLAGRQGRTMSELTRLGQQQGLTVYLFNSGDIDWEQSCVRGISYQVATNGRGQWIRGEFPLAQVVYNRVLTRKDEQSWEVQRCLRLLNDAGVTIFNTRYLNKLEVYRALASSPRIQSFLPHSCYYRQVADLGKMLELFQSVLLKPISSSLGRGMILVSRLSQDDCQCQWVTATGEHKTRVVPWPRVAMILPSLMGNRGYLVQQQIALACYQGSVFDIRALVQKDADHLWHRTGLAVRRAAPGHFVTHLFNGGSRHEFEVVMEDFCQGRLACYRKLVNELDNVMKEVPLLLEQKLGLHLAELTMDIGLDQDGKSWVLEINSKPFRFDEDLIRERGELRLLRYAESLIQ